MGKEFLRCGFVELPPLCGGAPSHKPSHGSPKKKEEPAPEEFQEPEYETEEFLPPEGEQYEGGEAPEQYEGEPLPPQTNLGPGGPWLDHEIPPQPGTIEGEPLPPPDEGEGGEPLLPPPPLSDDFSEEEPVR